MILILVSPRQRDLDVGAVMGDAARECIVLSGGPRPPGAAHVVVVDAYTVEELVSVGLQIAAHHVITRIVSFAEADVLPAARLRQELGLPGQNVASALAYRDKALMREYTERAELPTPAWWLVTSSVQVETIADEHGLPMVLKPRRSSGSVGVRVLRTREDLDDLPADLADHILEEFVNGDVVHVDGLMLDRTPVVALPAAYTELGCLAHLDDRGSGSHLLADNDPMHASLVTELWNVVDALPAAPNLLLHAEFFIREGERPVLCEIASRLPGHPIPPMINRALSIDLRAVWLRAEADVPVGAVIPSRPSQLVANYGLPPQQGSVAALPSRAPTAIAEWTHDLQVLADLGDSWDQRRYDERKSGDFVLTWTVTAPTASELAARVARSAEVFEGAVRWV